MGFRLPWLFLCSAALAAPSLQPIPRNPTESFVREGLFEGGTTAKANVEGIRVARHGVRERWVVDFSDVSTRTRGSTAPRFQVRYQPSVGEPQPDGTQHLHRPPRFQLAFRRIQKVFLTHRDIQGLLRKSRFVKEIVLYPPIEDGDMVMELVLRSDVQFEAHQPLVGSGRLVLDLQ